MKIDLLYEIQIPLPHGPTTEPDYFWQALAQVEAADRPGFGCAWAVEHHFLTEFAHYSAPEVFLTACAMRTERIRVGHGVALLPQRFNHPIRVAERAATLDICSKGRLEFGTGRSSPYEQEGFEVPTPLSRIARIDGFPPLSQILPPPRNGLDDDGDADDDHCKSTADNDESRPRGVDSQEVLRVNKLALVSVLLVSLGLSAPALATEPGTPMDCSDLELAPGLTCTTVSGPDVDLLSEGVVDNDGRVLVRADGSISDNLEVIGACGTTDLVRAALLYLDDVDGSRTPLVTVRWRCLDASAGRFEFVRFSNVLFHAAPGSLLVGAFSGCAATGGADCPGYPSMSWTARIDGFTPLADVLPPPPLPEPLCSNGRDDDGDGRTDAADAHCKSDADNDESRP